MYVARYSVLLSQRSHRKTLFGWLSYPNKSDCKAHHWHSAVIKPTIHSDLLSFYPSHVLYLTVLLFSAFTSQYNYSSLVAVFLLTLSSHQRRLAGIPRSSARWKLAKVFVRGRTKSSVCFGTSLVVPVHPLPLIILCRCYMLPHTQMMLKLFPDRATRFPASDPSPLLPCQAAPQNTLDRSPLCCGLLLIIYLM